VAFLEGRLRADALADAIAQATRRYAKRQETWFRHQLGGPALRLDARAAPDALARAVLDGYRAAGS
jgi:tRNA A37 N6-isopentenylltransferase MiaA